MHKRLEIPDILTDMRRPTGLKLPEKPSALAIEGSLLRQQLMTTLGNQELYQATMDENQNQERVIRQLASQVGLPAADVRATLNAVTLPIPSRSESGDSSAPFDTSSVADVSMRVDASTAMAEAEQQRKDLQKTQKRLNLLDIGHLALNPETAGRARHEFIASALAGEIPQRADAIQQYFQYKQQNRDMAERMAFNNLMTPDQIDRTLMERFLQENMSILQNLAPRPQQFYLDSSPASSSYSGPLTPASSLATTGLPMIMALQMDVPIDEETVRLMGIKSKTRLRTVNELVLHLATMKESQLQKINFNALPPTQSNLVIQAVMDARGQNTLQIEDAAVEKLRKIAPKSGGRISRIALRSSSVPRPSGDSPNRPAGPTLRRQNVSPPRAEKKWKASPVSS